jgi:copper chaperone
MEQNKFEIEVENVKCGGCAGSIRTRLMDKEGIEDVQVDIEEGRISIQGDISDIEGIISNLSAMGYPPKGSPNDVITRAKSFISCATGRLRNA